MGQAIFRPPIKEVKNSATASGVSHRYIFVILFAQMTQIRIEPRVVLQMFGGAEKGLGWHIGPNHNPFLRENPNYVIHVTGVTTVASGTDVGIVCYLGLIQIVT